MREDKTSYKNFLRKPEPKKPTAAKESPLPLAPPRPPEFWGEWRERHFKDVLARNFRRKRFVRENNLVVEHRDGSSTLIRIGSEKTGFLKVVRVRDSTTGRYYFLRVPSTVKTCKEGVAWTFGLSEEDYNPSKES